MRKNYSAMAKMNISVQLYTLRDQVQADLPGVLKALKKIGYAGAELAGYGSLKTAAEVKKAFDDAGLQVTGAHVGIDQAKNESARVIADHKTLGNNKVVIPWIGEPYTSSAQGYRNLAAECNAIGATLKAEGLHLGYHNHSFEFKTFDGQYGLDILWQHADPTLLFAELDLFWVKHGGVDPTAYLKQVGKRAKLVHLKDMAPGEDKKFAPVGNGTIDFVAISEAAAVAGVEWGVVEQDDCYGQDPLSVVEISFRNLQKLGIA